LQQTLCMQEPMQRIHVYQGSGLPLTYVFELEFADGLLYKHCNGNHPTLLFRKARDLKVYLKGYAATDPTMIRIQVVHNGAQTFFELDKLIRISAAKACIKNKLCGEGICTHQSNIEFADCRNNARLKLTSVVHVMKRPASNDVMSMLLKRGPTH